MEETLRLDVELVLVLLAFEPAVPVLIMVALELTRLRVLVIVDEGMGDFDLELVVVTVPLRVDGATERVAPAAEMLGFEVAFETAVRFVIWDGMVESVVGTTEALSFKHATGAGSLLAVVWIVLTTLEFPIF